MENLENEIWKDIIGYEGMYKINVFGVVKRVERYIMVGNFKQFYREKTLVNTKNKRGYVKVGLSMLGRKKSFSIHRLIAIHFIPNIDNKPHINHKNGIRDDNRIENLEWCTHKENMQHAHDTGLSKISNKCKLAIIKRNKLHTGERHYMSKPVLNTQNGIYYESVKDAAKSIDINEYTLHDYLKGRRKNKTNFIYA